ncbi:MAG: hypothetical protein KME32_17170 [Mojavia pulchra JT2-VF2]|jgi:hypothetical protein|uniref:Uncharacterized protein n=1 Tax=Mojavia pulchra JT2-VF2 TaxID=287848 RepID=A0A951Q0V7_9NOST|nr:hypothetical protein [Mojavia pulchra JT2-VF2]
MNTLDKKQSERDTSTQSRSRTLGFGDLAVMVSLVIIAAFIRFGYTNDQNTSASSGFINTSEIVNNTDTFIDKTVTVRSRPVDKVGFSSFTVNDQPLLNREPILVVNASGVPFNLPTDKNVKVQVTGQLRNLVIPDIEREFNVNLEDEYYTEYINRPAIIAQSITLAPQSSQNAQLQ